MVLLASAEDRLLKSLEGEVVGRLGRNVFDAVEDLALCHSLGFAQPTGNVAGKDERPVVLAEVHDAGVTAEDIGQPGRTASNLAEDENDRAFGGTGFHDRTSRCHCRAVVL